MALKNSDRVVVRKYGGGQFEGIIVAIDGDTVRITTAEEQRRAATEMRDPIAIGFPLRDVQAASSVENQKASRS